jgi:hypothetical protein
MDGWMVGWMDGWMGYRRSMSNHGLTEEDTRERDVWRNLVLGEGKTVEWTSPYMMMIMMMCKLTMSTSEIGPMLLTMMSTSMTAGGPEKETV